MWQTEEDAARLLGVTPETLHAWEELYGFPRSSPAPEGGRRYSGADVHALLSALSSELSIASAIAAAQRRSAAEQGG
jgi:DNA-binding transcriptional MerR regulator